jgi:membrane fusion protein, multidrug efflux system
MTSKIKHKFPITILLSVLVFVFFYHFSYFFPFTNNAFVVANVRAVAANVNGYITDIYVKNEQQVQKGQPLFTVFKKPYEFAYIKAKSDVAEAKAQLIVLTKQVEKTQHLIQEQKERYERYRFDYEHNKSALHDHAVSAIIVNTTLKEKNAAFSLLKALEKELDLNRQQIIVQKMRIKSLTAVMNNAKVDLDETTVYAQNNGAVQNMFVSLGTPIKIRNPIFSIADTDTLFIQANFNETDLRRVQPGNKVSIFPRIYFGSKIYHGVILSKHWAASRLQTQRLSQLEIVRNSESNWFLLPQRLPVQIQIIDYDPVHYPLSIGASAYVYIHAG